MDILFSLVLIVVGGLAALEVLNRSVKPVGKLVGSLEPYSEGFGIAGMILGIAWFLEFLALLRHFTLFPLAMLVALAGAMLLLSISLILGFDMLSKIVGTPSPGFVLKLDEWRLRLLPHKNQLGLAGIGFGVVLLLYIVI